ncbi:DUF6318 family protein [Brachybacterium huguangmaarense]
MASRHASMLAATGVLLLALTACGGDDEPAPTTPAASTTAPSESPAVSPSPSTSAPAVAAPDPADYPGMDQQTEEGAKAFYRYFWDSYVYANLTGDPSILESLSGPDCGWCRDVVIRVRNEGSTWTSGSIEYTDWAADMESEPQAIYVQFTSVVVEKTADGPTAQSSATPITAHAASQLQWSGTQWLVNSVDVEER